MTWQQTIDGASRSLNIPRHDACVRAGTGSASKAPPTLCGHCGGSGQVAALRFLWMSTPCPCSGRGYVIADPARPVLDRRADRGDGQSTSAGVDNGMQMRLRGEGSSAIRASAR